MHPIWDASHLHASQLQQLCALHHITAAAACMRCLCRGCAAFGVTTICRLAVSGCEDGLPVVAVSFVSVGGS